MANVAGQTMALHPKVMLQSQKRFVNLANKGFLLDTQGTWKYLYRGPCCSCEVHRNAVVTTCNGDDVQPGPYNACFLLMTGEIKSRYIAAKDSIVADARG